MYAASNNTSTVLPKGAPNWGAPFLCLYGNLPSRLRVCLPAGELQQPLQPHQPKHPQQRQAQLASGANPGGTPSWGAPFFLSAPPAHKGGAVRQIHITYCSLCMRCLAASSLARQSLPHFVPEAQMASGANPGVAAQGGTQGSSKELPGFPKEAPPHTYVYI